MFICFARCAVVVHVSLSVKKSIRSRFASSIREASSAIDGRGTAHSGHEIARARTWTFPCQFHLVRSLKTELADDSGRKFAAQSDQIHAGRFQLSHNKSSEYQLHSDLYLCVCSTASSSALRCILRRHQRSHVSMVMRRALIIQREGYKPLLESNFEQRFRNDFGFIFAIRSARGGNSLACENCRDPSAGAKHTLLMSDLADCFKMKDTQNANRDRRDLMLDFLPAGRTTGSGEYPRNRRIRRTDLSFRSVLIARTYAEIYGRVAREFRPHRWRSSRR